MWRPLLMQDETAVVAIAGQVHHAFPECAEALMSRVAVSPRTCFGLEGDGQLCGYVLAHPARLRAPPKLDTVITPTADPDTLFIHDLALLPEARGAGHGETITLRLRAAALGEGLSTLSLIAVHGSQRFWARLGFRSAPLPAGALISYGTDALYMVWDAAAN